jgi:N-methylhydantoinase B
MEYMAVALGPRAADQRCWTPPQFGIGHFGPAELHIASPAGGGWGDPRKRDPEAVLRDVRDGVVSEEAACRDYGVAIAADGKSIDALATGELRRKA